MNPSVTGMHGHLNADGTVSVLRTGDGKIATRIDADGVAVNGKLLRDNFGHPEGLIITKADAQRLELEILPDPKAAPQPVVKAVEPMPTRHPRDKFR